MVGRHFEKRSAQVFGQTFRILCDRFHTLHPKMGQRLLVKVKLPRSLSYITTGSSPVKFVFCSEVSMSGRFLCGSPIRGST